VDVGVLKMEKLPNITKAFKNMDREELELFAQNLFYQCAFYHNLLFDKYGDKNDKKMS